MTLEQRRARTAWEKVQANQALGDRFVNTAKAAPALIMGNGLMATLAFWQSRGKGEGNDPSNAVLGAVLAWLHERFPEIPTDFPGGMTQLQRLNSEKYMLVTGETLDFLKWLRQFAAASIRGN